MQIHLLVVLLAVVGSGFCQDLKREDALDFFCPENNQNGAFPHEENCDKYYECVAGEAALVTCPDGLLFDLKRASHGSKCDEPFNIDCGNRTFLQDPTPSPDGVCPRQNGRFEHEDPTVCDQYVVCRAGTWTMNPCAPGLHYDPYAGQCTWPALAKRQGCRKQKKKLPDGFECPDLDPNAGRRAGVVNPNPTYPHEKDCQLFYICISNDEPRLNKCSANLVFNIETGTCDDAENVPDCKDWFEPLPDEKPTPTPDPKRVANRPSAQSVQDSRQ